MTKKTYPDRIKALAEEESKLQGLYDDEIYDLGYGYAGCARLHVWKRFTRKESRQGQEARAKAHHDQDYTLLKQRVEENDRKPKHDTKQEKKRKHYTYTQTYKRSDGVSFTKDAIDGTPVTEIEQKIKDLRAKAKRLQGLVKSHKKLFG